MKEKYYKVKFYYNNTMKTYVVNATHIAQAHKRLIEILKLDYNKISDLTLNEIK